MDDNILDWSTFLKEIGFVDDEIKEEEPMKIHEVHVGMRIKMKTGGEFHFLNGKTGTVRYIMPDGRPSIGVEFDEEIAPGHDLHGRIDNSNGYFVPAEDLLLEGVEQQVVHEIDQEWLPERFCFAGQRVMVNPEMEGEINSLKRRKIDGNAGYVIDAQINDSDIITILINGRRHMEDWTVRVRFDNGYESEMRIKHLLQIEDYKPVKIIRLNYNTYRLLGDMDAETQQRIDVAVILEGDRLRETKVYDEDFKKKKIAEAYERLSS